MSSAARPETGPSSFSIAGTAGPSDRASSRSRKSRTVKRHRDGILRWFDSKIANGLIEAINSLVQAAKAKARGYRSLRNLIAITYLIAGKIDLKLAT